MIARWRILTLLALLVLWTVGSMPSAPTRAAYDRVSQAGQFGALPARRSDGSFALDPELDDDDGSAHPPDRTQLRGGEVGYADLAKPRPAERWIVERLGPSNPRAPPVLV